MRAARGGPPRRWPSTSAWVSRCSWRPPPERERSDAEYGAAGSEIVPGAADIFSRADVVLKVKQPHMNGALASMRPNSCAKARCSSRFCTQPHLRTTTSSVRSAIAAWWPSRWTASHDPARPADGSARLDAHDFGLQSGHQRGGKPARLRPQERHRPRQHRTGRLSCRGRGRSWHAGNRDGAPPRRAGDRFQHPRGGARSRVARSPCQARGSSPRA